MQVMEQRRKHLHRVHVPQELVNDILLRLPVKSLLRFKTVSKTWYNLICSSYFTNNYHSLHPNCRVHLLVYRSNVSNSQQQEINFAVFPDETLSGNPPSHYDLKLPCHDNLEKGYRFAIGPVNGFFLLCEQQFWLSMNRYIHFELVNPATKEYSKELTLHVPNSPPNFVDPGGVMIGFGFVNNAFKVVTLWRLKDFHGGNLHRIGAVYSSDNDSWTYFRPNGLPQGLDNTLSLNTYCGAMHANTSAYCGVTHANNGSCYWTLTLTEDLVRRNSYSYSLLSFDMNSEMFREIKIEGPLIKNPTTKAAHLLLHNDYISMILFPSTWDHADDKSTEFWVMKEDECWTKYLTLNLHENWGLPAKEALLGAWNYHQLLLRMTSDRGDQLVIYDVDSGEIRELGTSGFFQVFKYKESLTCLASLKDI